MPAPDTRENSSKLFAKLAALLPAWAGSLRSAEARDGLLLIGGTAIGQALVVVVTPILTRLYSPADFGLLGLFSAFVTGAAVVVSLRYEIAIPSASREEAAQLLFVALLVALPLSLLASAILLVMHRANLLSYGLLPVWMSVAAFPAVYCASAGASLRYWLIRARRFRDMGLILITQGAGRAFVPVVIGIESFLGGGLVAGEVAGRILGVARPLAEAAPDLPAVRPFVASPEFRALLRRYWKLPVISMPSSLVDVLSMSLPVVLITHLYGATQAGLFILVQRIVSLPTSLVGFSAADIFHVRLSEEASKGLPAMRRLVYSTALRLTALGLCFLVPLAAIAPLVAVPVLGKAWADAGILMIILSPWSLAGLVVSPLSRVLAVTFKLELKIIYDVTALAFVFLALEVARATNVGFLGAMLGMSLLRVIAYIIYLAVILYALRDRAPAAQ
jgi:lipopolysaccharide exporter